MTIADCFRAGGYRTGLVGKWHNGALDPRYHPNARGFEEFVGFCGGGSDYWDYGARPERGRGGRRRSLPHGRASRSMRSASCGGMPENRSSSSSRTTRRTFRCRRPNSSSTATSRPARHSCRPHLRDDRGDGHRGRPDRRRAPGDRPGGQHNRRVRERQRAVPREVQGVSLDRYNHGWRGAKHYVFEGGIRVPAIVRWPAELDAGLVAREMVHFTDCRRHRRRPPA